MIYSMFCLFSLQVLKILDLKVLEFLLLIELAILEWFLTWCFKHERIPIYRYFQRSNRWLNLVAYVGKCVDFVLHIRVPYIAHFFIQILLLIRENNKGEEYFPDTFGLQM